VCVRDKMKREREEKKWVFVCMWKRRERESACDRDKACLNVCVIERERVIEWMCVDVQKLECVCVIIKM